MATINDLVAAEADCKRLEVENKRLRQIISDCASALPNGAFISPECSVAFMERLPVEIRACFARLNGARYGVKHGFLNEQNARLDAAVDDMMERYPKTLDHLKGV
jgi:hypothetical protein